jgi:hypothetical protein
VAATRHPDVARWRASLARRAQSYPADHPKIIEAARNLRAANAAHYLREVVTALPPLTGEQRKQLADLLWPVEESTH